MDLRTFFHTAAPVQIYDETDGVFGQLIHPELVVSSVNHHCMADDLIGNIDRGSAPAVEIRSQAYAPTTYRDSGGKEVTTNEVSIEIDNTSSLWIKVRWIDAHWSNPPTHVWTIKPSSIWTQFVKVGHLFVLSVVPNSPSDDLFESSSEIVLGAFRPTKRLPSGSPHCLLVQGEEPLSSCALEVMLMDKTKLDSLCIAASSLDHEITSSRARTLATLSTLKQIVKNVERHPSEDKYRRLRLSNHRIEREISRSLGAMDLLRVLGFQETEVSTTQESCAPGERASATETFLVLPEPSNGVLERFAKASEMLVMLSQHADPNHKTELSASVPWQAAMRASGTGRNNWNSEGTHFSTGDERWERVDRAQRLRRSGGGPPPAPGHAPSSRGRWGR